MALQPYNDGSFNILYDDSKTVLLRDTFAQYTNTLTDAAVKYLEDQKADEERKLHERTERARQAAFPVSRAIGIEKEKKRVNTHLDMMGTDLVPSAAVLNKPTTLTPPKKPLVEPNPNRLVKTNKGEIEVGPDVSDADIRSLGYIIEGDEQSGDNQDTTSATGVEHSNSPVEDNQ